MGEDKGKEQLAQELAQEIELAAELEISAAMSRQASEALRASEAWYRSLMEKMRDIVWTADMDLHRTKGREGYMVRNERLLRQTIKETEYGKSMGSQIGKDAHAL